MVILSDFTEDEKTNQIHTNPSQESESQQLQPIKPSSDADATDNQRKQEQEQQEEKDQKPKPLLPNKANGLDMENYSWGQSLQEININVSVPPGTKASFVSVDIKTDKIKIGLKNKDPVLEGHLLKGVKVQDSFWSLEDNKTISVLLTKIDRKDWWKSLLKGGPEINTEKVEPVPSSLSELDIEMRSTIEKVMFDRRQKARGLPTSDEIVNQEMMKKFMAERPEIDASEANNLMSPPN